MQIVEYVCYSRFSPRPDSAESESCDTQERDLREEVDKRKGCVVAAFSDPDTKGDDEDREGLWTAMAALTKGRVLLVWKGDRLARSVYLSEYLHREAKKAGAKIEYLHGRNGDSPDDILVRQILAAVDEHAKKVNAIRTKYMMLSMQRNGRCVGGIPLGQRSARAEGVTKRGKPRRSLVPDASEQQALQRILELRETGAGSFLIAKALNDEGVPCRGQRWHRGSIERLLKRLAEPAR